LRETYRNAYRERVGKNPSEAAMNAFVEHFHSVEGRAGQTYNDAAPGSTIVQPPSAGTEATDQVRKNSGAEEQAYQTITRMNDFYGMLDSPV
jgi:hypothetical protein